MKTFFVVIVLAASLVACQRKQYFSASPEIDVAKKRNEAYLTADWTSLKALYIDTAKILINGHEITVDAFVELQKSEVSTLLEYQIGDDIHEMVELDNGDRWVHSWLKWTGTYKNGKEVSVPVHITTQVINGKIVWQGFIVDTLPGYLAQQP